MFTDDMQFTANQELLLDAESICSGDVRTIVRAHNIYAYALDQRNWALLDAVFHETCWARYGDNAAVLGRQAIVNAIRGYLDGCGPTQHLISNIMVIRADNCLYSLASVQAVHRGQSGNSIFTSVARYHGQWTQIDGRWLAVRWRMLVDINHGDPSVFGL